jgi:hypothetical protein
VYEGRFFHREFIMDCDTALGATAGCDRSSIISKDIRAKPLSRQIRPERGGDPSVIGLIGNMLAI